MVSNRGFFDLEVKNSAGKYYNFILQEFKTAITTSTAAASSCATENSNEVPIISANSNIKVGMFVTGDGIDDVIIHYIDEIIQFDENTLVFKSKPEISNLQDRWIIEEQDIIVIYMYQVESVGKILLFLNSWIGRIVLLVDIILVWIIVDVLFPKKEKNKKDLSKNVNKTEPKEETQP